MINSGIKLSVSIRALLKCEIKCTALESQIIGGHLTFVANFGILRAWKTLNRGYDPKNFESSKL
ncbi:hypothetical protein BpHYR1_046353 [Brachionus plicatilis]|uniref:Uncharacterized protein n=1 Tax=Brachionus plicatilis TaxID=10195 RepID=A0A3M7R0J7_BRAPC|nr:hypothetical protein BpHYR1_046353 [Brachionus plicatilis]